ncbi:hypothetical protein NON08_10950 [Cetobacterium somerae]|uniref:hypothetical protein n=1 Tax=Cetobacterium sp. NK01 TaxID=2993530 RepID=UPI002116FA6E|nr:hypothetical protein [Cetobacterium sp. NK01]MCQ8213034.1 hypothetical protein [Cetobacterium sp. NK01]
MIKIFIILFLVSIKAIGETSNVVSINYKYNEPLLGKGHYLTISDIPIPTYSNTTGYFSNVEIVGKNLKIEKDLKKVIIKKGEEIIKEKEVEWKQYSFEIEELDLDGITINLKWRSLNRQKMELMVSNWNLEKKSYELQIEYIYSNKKEIQNLNINMPEFNPDIYLNFDYKLPILKRQEYGKKYLIVKKISLNEYDLEITKNNAKKDGLKLILGKFANVEEQNTKEEIREDRNEIRVVPLIEKYPNVFVEELDNNDIFKSSKEIFIGLELPKNIKYNSNYKIFGDILEIEYGKTKKTLIDKIILTNGMNKVSKVIVLTNWYKENEKILINNLNENQRYYETESIGKVQKAYKNLKIKIGEKEEEIDKDGISKLISLDNIKIKVENGMVWLSIIDLNILEQGFEINYDILNNNDEVIDRVNLKFYLEN